MNSQFKITTLALLAPIALSSCATATEDAKKPNVVMILLDDVGYSDFGCFGSEINTPNIDRLANNGIRVRNFYNQARSGPTRASLMTGLYPHQVGNGSLNKVKGYECYQGHPNWENAFIPEVLSSAGYFSIMTGKWHLGYFEGSTPIKRGFDRSFNAPVGAFYFADNNPTEAEPRNRYKFCCNDVDVPLNDPSLPEGWYSTDMWTDRGLEYVDEALDSDKPFFWYLAYNGAHFPIQAPAETIAKYRGKYMDGFENVRNRRYAKQLELGLFDESDELTPRSPLVKDWDKMSDKERDRFDHIMAIYAASIEEMDKNIGKMMDHLEERGELDNTLIILCSDNGGNGESGVKGVLRGENPGGPGSVVWLGSSWADVANTPYFLYKHHGHEGGCNTSMIISYPNGMDKTLCGSIQKEGYGHVIDIMPTLVELTGATYPTVNKAGKDVPPMEGISLLPILQGEPVGADRPVIVEHEGNKMLRLGDWKIVQEYKEPKWMLHNLREDPTEMHDLAEVNKDKLDSMISTYKDMADHINVEESIPFHIGAWYTSIENYLKQPTSKVKQ